MAPSFDSPDNTPVTTAAPAPTAATVIRSFLCASASSSTRMRAATSPTSMSANNCGPAMITMKGTVTTVMAPTTSCCPTYPSPRPKSSMAETSAPAPPPKDCAMPLNRNADPTDSTASTPAIHSSVLFFSGTISATTSPSSA